MKKKRKKITAIEQSQLAWQNVLFLKCFVLLENKKKSRNLISPRYLGSEQKIQ